MAKSPRDVSEGSILARGAPAVCGQRAEHPRVLPAGATHRICILRLAADAWRVRRWISLLSRSSRWVVLSWYAAGRGDGTGGGGAPFCRARAELQVNHFHPRLSTKNQNSLFPQGSFSSPCLAHHDLRQVQVHFVADTFSAAETVTLDAAGGSNSLTGSP